MYELLDRVDGYSALRNGLRRVAEDRDEWSGIPMPLEAAHLVIEPTYPKAAELMAIGGSDTDPPPGTEPQAKVRVRNSFWSMHRRSEVVVYEKPDGKVTYGLVPGFHHLDQLLRTLGCSDAWGIEQEKNALDLLGTLIRHRAFKQYLLTGSFLESSKRSGVTYFFRKLRPTIAMHDVNGYMRVMCALCMHPLAYYEDSWAGAMTPTDDVIAHLMLMRGDEAMFWRRCSQHPAWRPQAGI